MASAQQSSVNTLPYFPAPVTFPLQWFPSFVLNCFSRKLLLGLSLANTFFLSSCLLKIRGVTFAEESKMELLRLLIPNTHRLAEITDLDLWLSSC